MQAWATRVTFNLPRSYGLYDPGRAWEIGRASTLPGKIGTQSYLVRWLGRPRDGCETLMAAENIADGSTARPRRELYVTQPAAHDGRLF